MTKLLFFAFALLSACAPVYVPNVRNSPMFAKGGEFQASVQVGNGLEAQSAYAVSNHFGVMLNYSYINNSGYDVDNEDDYHRHRLFEGGIGYFLNKDNSFFEVFAGYGQGKGSSVDTYEFFGTESIIATGKYERYFLQPAFGVNKGIMNLAFAPRFTMVDFQEFSNEITSYDVQEEAKFFFEPAVIGRANFASNRVFFTFQVGASMAVSTDVYFDRRRLQASAGFGLRLGGLKAEVSRL